MAARPPTDADGIALALRETFPDLGAVSVRRTLGSGFNSIAVETDGGLVFRVAKTSGTSVRFALERRLLSIVRTRLAIAVPEPRWLVERSAWFPFGVSGYPKIEGRTLAPALLRPENVDRLAGQLARVLLTLRRTEAAELSHVGLPGPEGRPAHYRALRDETLPALRARLSAAEYDRIEAWWRSFLGDERLEQFQAVLCHGDFWFENMLVDEGAGRLVGIVDWEHAALGDPALDFSTLLHLGEEFTARAIEAYRGAGGAFGEEERYRMRRLWEVRHFYGVLFGVRFQDEEELADGVRKLRAGPIVDGP